MSVRSRNQKGTVIVLVVIMLGTLLSFGALSYDIGYLTVVRTQLQAAADAAALAGAGSLSNSTQASTFAQQVATSNLPGNGTVLATSDISTGTWNSTTRTLLPATGTPNAIQIVVRRAKANGNPVSLIFAPIFGVNTADVSAAAIAQVTYPPLPYGILGISSVSMSGSAMVDSYNSSNGPYSSSTATSNGNVASGGNITMSGSSTVKGNANPGPGDSVLKSGSASVTGSTSALTQTPSYSSISAPTTYNNNGLGSSISLSGSTNLNLAPGTYYFNSINTSGSSQITISGPTTIYISGSLNISGSGIVNTTSIPDNLNLLMTSTATSVNLSGSSAFYGVVYGPTATLNLSGSSGFYGGFVGKTVTLSGSAAIHRDTSVLETFLSPQIKLIQ